MLIKLNSKNLFIFLLISAFLYLAYLIWTAKESFPAIDVELRDLVSYIALAVETGGHAVSRIYAEKSGDVGMEIYGKGQMDVGRAELLTRADLISNSLMLGLLRRFPLLRVVSEEKSNIGEQELAKYRSDNYELWMGLREVLSKLPTWRVPLNRIVIWIDPLDATQEFTEGLTEYVTVMACIAVDGKPFVGAIYSPFKGEIVLGMVDYGLVSSRDGKIKNILRAASSGNRTVLVSRSHAGNVSKLVERTFGTESPGYVVEPAGGAGYKTLRLIRQTADLYVHTTAIKKWDICAGDALIRAGGGALLSLADGLPIDYSIKWEEEQNAKDGPTKNNHKVHSGGMLMALESPFSIYEQLKKHLN